jgi:hypothetical protein
VETDDLSVIAAVEIMTASDSIAPRFDLFVRLLICVLNGLNIRSTTSAIAPTRYMIAFHRADFGFVVSRKTCTICILAIARKYNEIAHNKISTYRFMRIVLKYYIIISNEL